MCKWQKYRLKVVPQKCLYCNKLVANQLEIRRSFSPSLVITWISTLKQIMGSAREMSQFCQSKQSEQLKCHWRSCAIRKKSCQFATLHSSSRVHGTLAPSLASYHTVEIFKRTRWIDSFSKVTTFFNSFWTASSNASTRLAHYNKWLTKWLSPAGKFKLQFVCCCPIN